MALFFEYRPTDRPATKQALRDALAKAPPPANHLEAEVNAMADAVAAQAGVGGVQPKVQSFIAAAVLLAVIAALALWAEHAQMTKAPDQLWTAFQSILGVIVGLLGGEASGIATVQKDRG
jgi:hypothetical protein